MIHGRERARARSNSSRGVLLASPDLDARHKVASLTAQLIQRDHRIRGLEQGVASKLAEVTDHSVHGVGHAGGV